MGSYTALSNLTEGDLVPEAWVDGVSNNLDYLLNPNSQLSDGTTFLTTTGSTFANIAGASAVVTAHGGPLLVVFSVALASGANGGGYLDIVADGASQSNGSGFMAWGGTQGVQLTTIVTGLASGAHTLAAQWKINGPSTVTAAMSGLRRFAAIEL